MAQAIPKAEFFRGSTLIYFSTAANGASRSNILAALMRGLFRWKRHRAHFTQVDSDAALSGFAAFLCSLPAQELLYPVIACLIPLYSFVATL